MQHQKENNFNNEIERSEAIENQWEEFKNNFISQFLKSAANLKENILNDLEKHQKSAISIKNKNLLSFFFQKKYPTTFDSIIEKLKNTKEKDYFLNPKEFTQDLKNLEKNENIPEETKLKTKNTLSKLEIVTLKTQEYNSAKNEYDLFRNDDTEITKNQIQKLFTELLKKHTELKKIWNCYQIAAQNRSNLNNADSLYESGSKQIYIAGKEIISDKNARNRYDRNGELINKLQKKIPIYTEEGEKLLTEINQSKKIIANAGLVNDELDLRSNTGGRPKADNINDLSETQRQGILTILNKIDQTAYQDLINETKKIYSRKIEYPDFLLESSYQEEKAEYEIAKP